MTAPSQDALKTLEQSRQRLIQLTHSLGSLIASLNTTDPLPSWPSLQTQSNIISSNLQTLSSHLTENQDLFGSLVAYPAPSYPTQAHGNILEQLLRTKLDPKVEEWVGRGRERAGTGAGEKAGQAGGEELSGEQLAELWGWAPVEANREARRRDWGGDFTLEEQEKGFEGVVTGLRRRLDVGDEEEEEEEEEEEREEVAKEPEPPSVSLDDTLRFMTTGSLPARQR